MKSQLLMKFPLGAVLPTADTNFSVRTADRGDATALAHLLGVSFPELVWTPERCLTDLIDADDVAVVFVIEDGDRLIGTASARYWSKFPGRGYVHWVGVDPTCRGRRLSRSLIVHLLRRFAEDRALPAILETDDERIAAITAYLGLGFVPEYPDQDHESRWAAVFQQMMVQRIQREGQR